MGSDPITITVDLTIADYRWAVQHGSSRGSWTPIYVVGYGLIAMGVLGLASGEVGFYCGWGLILLGLFKLLYSAFRVHRYWDRIKNELARSSRTVEIRLDETGVKKTFALMNSFYQWPAFSHFFEDRARILLYMPMYAHTVIPKRSIKTTEELVHLRSLIVSKLPGANPVRPYLPCADLTKLPEPANVKSNDVKEATEQSR